MQSTGFCHSRFAAVLVLIAGAALLAGTVPRAAAQPLSADTLPAEASRERAGAAEETALANPRYGLRQLQGVALPQPLPPSEAARIHHVFALQRAGNLRDATAEAAQLDPDITFEGMALGRAMQGYILADRHLGRFTRPAAAALQDWLDRWPDLADAPAVHTLLLHRLPRGAARPPAPEAAMLPADPPGAPATAPVPEETEPVGDLPARNPALDQAVHDAARAGRADAVARLLARTRGLASRYAALLRGEAAQILFTLNHDAEAFDLAAASVRACPRGTGPCDGAALAGHSAGLAAWRMGRPEQAAQMFEAGWRAALSTSSLRAATAFWAARAHLRQRDPEGALPWMRRAAGEPQTFYGMLARRVLGLGIGLGIGRGDALETLSEADIEAVAATPQGLRAFALLQVGQDHRAEAELRRLWPSARSSPALGRAIMLVAERAGLVELAAQLADLAQSADGRPRARMRFPVPRLRPAGGFRVDPALVYGIARTESNFDADLESRAGALGLMQVMPETASFLTGAPATPELQGQLRDPSLNLDLGQRYVGYLAGQEPVRGDLLRLLAAYNAGPGALARWSGGMRDGGDPLLFIEAVPPDETRAYVPRVLAYTWIYAARLHLPTPSLDELAAGVWPRYHPPDPAPDPANEPPARLH